jgi:FkbM family methyltransferase
MCIDRVRFGGQRKAVVDLNEINSRLALLDRLVERIDQINSRLTVLDHLVERIDQINLQLTQLERLTHGGRAVNVGNNRLLVKTVVDDANLAFLVEADDRLVVPRFFVEGRYEAEITNFLLSNIKHNSNCVDIGANFGYYTCLMARRALGGKTIGVEPDQKVFELLRDNIYINGLEAMATSMHAAVAHKEGTLTLHRRLTRSGNTSVIRESEEKIRYLGEAASEAFEIRCFPLDVLLPQFEGRVDYVKIDVEGAEPLVLSGAQQTIANNRRIQIVMEWAPNQIRGAGFDIAQFTGELASMGLCASTLGIQGPEPISWDTLLGLPYLSGILLTSTA